METIVDRVVKMMKYRGYKSVEVLDTTHGPLIYAKEQQNEDHPRPDAQALAIIDESPNFSASHVHQVIAMLYDIANQHKAPPDSSIIFIYAFQMKDPHVVKIEKAYSDVIDNSALRIAFFFEKISVQLFLHDWSKPRSTRNWRILPISKIVLMYTPDGKPLVIDRPPLILASSPEVQYIGGRKGDCVIFERIESMDVGPIWMISMRKVDLHEVEMPDDD